MSQVGPGGFENVAGRVGSGQEVFEMSRVGSGRVNKFSILTGRVESGQQVFKSRGSGQVMSRDSELSRDRSGRLTRISNRPRSGPVGWDRVIILEMRVIHESGHHDARVVFG